MIYVIEIENKTTGKYKYLAFDDHSGGYPWFPEGMWSAARMKTFDEARNEYQRMVSASKVTTTRGEVYLPSDLRAASGINGTTVQDALITVSILEVSGDTWPELKVERVVSHTIQLHEGDDVVSVQVIDAKGI